MPPKRSTPMYTHLDNPTTRSNPLSPRNQLWEAHLERLHRLGGAPPPVRHGRARAALPTHIRDAESAQYGEWTAPPLGRFGRPLLAEVESYLEFFAIARAG
jgi:hypothetical protein